MHPSRVFFAAVAAATLLAACGGGSDSDATPDDTPVSAPRVSSFGDSLSDLGSLGLRHTVQSDTGSPVVPYPLWTELQAARLSAKTLCNVYQYDDTNGFSADTDCSSHAVAGARIVHSDTASPLSIPYQLQSAGTTPGDTGYADDEWVYITGGGNDTAALLSAYLGAYYTFATTLQVEDYIAFLAPVLGEDEARAMVNVVPGGWEIAAEAYMNALAVQFAAAIRSSVLDSGAQHIVILNIPDITRTPRYQALSGQIAELLGRFDNSGEPVAKMTLALQSWITAFNERLALSFLDDQRVVIIDGYSAVQHWATNATELGLTNATDPACPATVQEGALPVYDIAQCTTSYLDANPPSADAGAGWWQTYAYADDFHPTPRGHELMSETATAAIANKGWQ